MTVKNFITWTSGRCTIQLYVAIISFYFIVKQLICHRANFHPLIDMHKLTSLLQNRNHYDPKQLCSMDPRDMYYSTLLIPFPCKLVCLSLQPFPPFNDRGKPTSLLHRRNPYDCKNFITWTPGTCTIQLINSIINSISL